MIIFLGYNLILNKKIFIELTKVYGIGISTSKKILKNLNINLNSNVSNISEKEIIKIREYIEKSNLKLENNLKNFDKLNIINLKEINSYKGKRHSKGLPVHGQRTRTNAKTSRKIFLKNKLYDKTKK